MHFISALVKKKKLRCVGMKNYTSYNDVCAAENDAGVHELTITNGVGSPEENAKRLIRKRGKFDFKFYEVYLL